MFIYISNRFLAWFLQLQQKKVIKYRKYLRKHTCKPNMRAINGLFQIIVVVSVIETKSDQQLNAQQLSDQMWSSQRWHLLEESVHNGKKFTLTKSIQPIQSVTINQGVNMSALNVCECPGLFFLLLFLLLRFSEICRRYEEWGHWLLLSSLRPHSYLIVCVVKCIWCSMINCIKLQ